MSVEFSIILQSGDILQISKHFFLLTFSHISLFVLTVGNPHTLHVPAGVEDHEDDAEDRLQEEEAEDGHHGEGRHHGVGLLQVGSVDGVRGEGGEGLLVLVLRLGQRGISSSSCLTMRTSISSSMSVGGWGASSSSMAVTNSTQFKSDRSVNT